MAINKELYERYKAMKAAKLASEEENSKKVNAETDKNYNHWSTQYSDINNSSPNAEERPLNDYNNPDQISNYNTQFSTCYNSGIEVNTIEKVPKTGLKKFALIGYPLGHSLSEYIHLAGFKSLGIDATYEILPTQPQDLVERVKYLRNNGYSGFNVTIPHKLPVTMFLDEIDPSANVVNAINTVAINSTTNVLRGYNTDATGFIKAIPQDFSLYNKTVAILGTGGAARAAITALAHKNVKEIKLFSRNITNCIELLEYLRKTFPNTQFNSYQIDRFKNLPEIDLVVNCTPIGMSGKYVGYSPLEEGEITTLPSHALIYDVVYNPKKTNLIKLAKKYNYKTVTGLDMLIYQAQEAQKIWFGQLPDFKDMKIAALENLD